MTENPYSTPESQLNNVTQKKGFLESFALNFLRHWNGRAKLVSAFWGHFIAGNFLFAFIFVMTAIGFRALSSEPGSVSSVVQVVLAVLGFIYYICTVRFIWACARNSSYSGFFYIVRGLILAVIILIVGIFSLTAYDVISNS